MNREILNLKNLSVSYGDINILKDIDLSLKKGEILGIVGESGSGKSTLIKSIMGILDENASIDGEINFEGKDLASLSLKDYRKIKGKEISMIFQNPTGFTTYQACDNRSSSLGYWMCFIDSKARKIEK